MDEIYNPREVTILESLDPENEIWKQVPEKYGPYEASTLGNVRNADGEPVKQHETQGYLYVRVGRPGALHFIKTHWLVLETFVEERPKGMVSRHLDGTRNNNRLRNLKWGTQKENMDDKVRHKGGTKINRCDALFIKNLLNADALDTNEIARLYGVDTSVISSVACGNSWAGLRVEGYNIHLVLSWFHFHRLPIPEWMELKLKQRQNQISNFKSQLWEDLATDEDRVNFLRSGQALGSALIAESMIEDVADAFEFRSVTTKKIEAISSIIS